MTNGRSQSEPRLVAITGPSCGGKSWLVAQLLGRLGKEATALSLDDFYLDLSHLTPGRRARVNFDHPRAIDWPLFRRVLARCQVGTAPSRIPVYDFTHHIRLNRLRCWRPKPIVLLEGLWLLRQPDVRRLFSLSIYIRCGDGLARQRRLERDVKERGRTVEAVRSQFDGRVSPMCRRFVSPQERWADVVIEAPIRAGVVDQLTVRIRQLTPAGGLAPGNDTNPTTAL
ncbi:MAG: uridine kinase [Verrucomicrobiota bacterium]